MRKQSMLGMLLRISIIPAMLVDVLTTGSALVKMNQELNESIREELKIASEGLNMYYARGSTYEHDYVDSLKDDGIELTLFLEDTRYITSLENEDGSRNEGTKADAEIWEIVKSGEDYFSNDVEINGVDFSVYYTPVFDDKNTVAGMAFAGMSQDNIKALMNDSGAKYLINMS